MKTQTLHLDLIRTDGGTQSRIRINEDTISDYSEMLKELPVTEWPFPPLEVFHDGSEYFLADGFHRDLAALRAGRASAPCLVYKGSAFDALIHGMKANDKHGLRRTPADKRFNVEQLLDCGKKMSQKEISEKAGVSVRLVQTVVSERNPVSMAGKLPTPRSDAHAAPSTPTRGGSRPRSAPKDEPKDYGKCPNCAGTKWSEDEEGVSCAKCHHPHGEPAGDVDDKQVSLQRSKTIKTVEALMRAFDDLNTIKANGHIEAAIEGCKALLRMARAWK